MGPTVKRSRHGRYIVPTLRSMASHALQRHQDVQARPHQSRIYTTGHIRPLMGDVQMSESRSSGTQTNKRRRDAAEGASQVGQGLTVTVPKSVPHGYNNNYTVKLTYADNFRHDIAQAAGSATQIFCTNSIFDPDITGTGHQPHLS